MLLLKQHIIAEENRKAQQRAADNARRAAEANMRRQQQQFRQQQSRGMAPRGGMGMGHGTGMAGRRMGGGGGMGGVTRRKVVDHVSTEQAREAREKVLAAQAALRVAAVKVRPRVGPHLIAASVHQTC